MRADRATLETRYLWAAQRLADFEREVGIRAEGVIAQRASSGHAYHASLRQRRRAARLLRKLDRIAEALGYESEGMKALARRRAVLAGGFIE